MTSITLLLNILCPLTWHVKDKKRNSIQTGGINFKTIKEKILTEKVETKVDNFVVALNLNTNTGKFGYTMIKCNRPFDPLLLDSTILPATPVVQI